MTIMPLQLAGTVPPTAPYDADIIILALERAEDTLRAIRSAQAQNSVRAHIFVLDQGSSAATLARFADAVSAIPNAALFASGRNLGVAAGRNVLSSLGHGRIIVGLDNDAAFPKPDTVAQLLAALNAEPRLAAIGCRLVDPRTGLDDVSSWGYPTSLLASAAESFDAVTFVGAGHAIRRTAWEQAGGYDPTLFFCWEEFDFCLRAMALGWRIRYRGDIAIHHGVSPEQRVSWSGDRWFYFVRNRVYIARKHHRPWRCLMPRIAAYLLKGAVLGQPGRTLRAIVAASRMRPPPIPAPLPQAAASYIRRNDAAHRGSLPRRLIHEVVGLADRAPAPARR